ncbi:hypothetical protein GWK08_15580 [Leptobacterium flavescens]|uniref:DUF2147 domain-containing protein n=1 Tax=Leptobacterium flavescens TaxID=472055 RepID=A0A6P0UPF3_9FLAO|nr:hypothetical protein [Leptobacterium flavescens]NER14877.1 hypothetical protein [Leptobacterium flavescens]
MKILKTLFAMAILLVSLTKATAQTDDPLIGKWEVEYKEDNEKSYVIHEFRKEQGVLKCYTVFVKDDKGNGEEYESVAIKDITFKGGSGTGTYMFTHEGEKYEFRARLKLKDHNTLTISYSAWGYVDSETWKRLK